MGSPALNDKSFVQASVKPLTDSSMLENCKETRAFAAATWYTQTFSTSTELAAGSWTLSSAW